MTQAWHKAKQVKNGTPGNDSSHCWCEKLIRGSHVSLNCVIKGVLFGFTFLGCEVDYVGDFPGLGLQPGNFIVRVLILLWTGDYPAQSEIGKFINGGIYPCRRDKLKGELLQNVACQPGSLYLGKRKALSKNFQVVPTLM